VSFAEAETVQLADAERSKVSGATVSTVMPHGGVGETGSGTGVASVALGPAAVTGGIRDSKATPREIRDPAPMYPEAARQQRIRKPLPAGMEIPASDGDRVIVDDDARVQVVRRRQATIRTIFSQEQRALIVLADYAKPGQFPDGNVDSTFNFYELEGDWPLEPRWEALTTMFQYEGDPTLPIGYAVATPQGLVHLSPGRPGMQTPESAAIAVLWYRASTIGQGHTLSFAEAEKRQLAEAAKHRSAPGVGP
jgi:hypothetical protein